MCRNAFPNSGLHCLGPLRSENVIANEAGAQDRIASRNGGLLA